MNLLALDLATLTGWAYDIKGVRESGTATFPVHAGEADGWRFIRFSVWLYSWKDRGIDCVVLEKPHHRGAAATMVAIGLFTRVEEFCARQRIPHLAVHTSTLKKFATGNGRAEKPAMIAFAQNLKRGVTDDNEADALWLLEYGLANAKLKRRAS